MFRFQRIIVLMPAIFVALVELNNYSAAAGAEISDPEFLSELKSVATSPHRAPYNRARDSYRNPVETLAFFGVEPDMHVAEIWPGGGAYFAEIIAPYVAASGRYYAVVPSLRAASEKSHRANRMLFERFETRPDIYGSPMRADMSAMDMTLYGDSSLDMVLSFRNLHNWATGGYDQHFMAGIYRALKPGGYFGMTDHRLDGSPHEEKRVYGGYVTEDYAIEVAEGAGFVFLARSEINANLKDIKDYPEGVWTLPPTLALGDRERQRFLEIGESDRMTLLFQKPESQP